MPTEIYRNIEAGLTESGGLLAITLAAGKGNVLSKAVMEEISAALDAHRTADGLKMVLLEAEGPHFSYGASVEEHKKETAPAMLRAFHRLVRQIATYPVPVAAFVHGRCLGGAFEVVLACHFVFATPGAVFGCPEIKLGVFPPVLAAIGAQRLGGPTVEALLLTGGDLDAETAHRIGWLTGVIEVDEPREAVRAWYRTNLAPLSASSLRLATRVARESSGLVRAVGEPLDHAEAVYVNELLATHDGTEGILAFLERRKPEWSGE